MLALVASVNCQSPLATSLWASVACMATLSQQATFWSITTEISGPHLGAIFGLMNSMGVPGGFASSKFFGQFVDWMKSLGYEGRAQWDPAFYVAAGVLVVGACCWLAVDAQARVREPERDSPLIWEGEAPAEPKNHQQVERLTLPARREPRPPARITAKFPIEFPDMLTKREHGTCARTSRRNLIHDYRYFFFTPSASSCLAMSLACSRVFTFWSIALIVPSGPM